MVTQQGWSDDNIRKHLPLLQQAMYFGSCRLCKFQQTEHSRWILLITWFSILLVDS